MKKYLLIFLNVFILNSQNLKKLDDYSNKFFEAKDFEKKLSYANMFMSLAKKENKKIYSAIGYYLYANLYIDID